MNEEIKDGGQAFPQPIAVSPMGDCIPAHPGMSLRDYFAGQALIGLISGRTWSGSDEQIIKTWATSAYVVADEILKAREAA